MDRWDEAIPLGNGPPGGLLWGDGSELRLSLDSRRPVGPPHARTALRDELDLLNDPNAGRKEPGRGAGEVVDQPYGARLLPHQAARRPDRTLTVGPLAPVQRSAWASRGDRSAPTGRRRGGVDVFLSAVPSPWRCCVVRGPCPLALIVLPASCSSATRCRDRTAVLRRPGAAAARAGLKYAVVVATRRVGTEPQIALSVTSTRDAADPVALGRGKRKRRSRPGSTPCARRIRRGGRGSGRIGVRLPDAALQQHYDLVQYFYGAPRVAARRRCRCRACGRPTTAGCRRGRATTTTT